MAQGQFSPFCFISKKIHRLSTLIKQTKLKEHLSRNPERKKEARMCVYTCPYDGQIKQI